MRYNFWPGIFAGMFLLWGGIAAAQSGHSLLRQGDKSYQNQDYGQAEEKYRKALEKEPNPKGKYNLGNTVYQQDRYDEAVRSYEEAANSNADAGLKAKAYHNLGNAYFHQKEFEKSINAYKNALRLNPSDVETKYNLALAQKMLPPPPPPNPDQQEQDEQQNQDPNQEQKEDQQQQQQQNEQQNNQDQPSEGPDQKPENAPLQEKELTEEDVQQLLRSIADEEKKTLEKLRQAESKACSSAKDW